MRATYRPIDKAVVMPRPLAFIWISAQLVCLGLSVSGCGCEQDGGPLQTVATPTISYEAAADESFHITITCETEGATIYYTTDGTEPSEACPTYAGTVTVQPGTWVKAQASRFDMSPSAIARSYFGTEGTTGKLNEDVVVSGQEGEQVTSEAITYPPDVSAPSVEVGDVIMRPGTDGYLRKVVSVEEQDGNVVVKTEQAALTDAFEELHIDASIYIDSFNQTKVVSRSQKVGGGLAGWIGATWAPPNLGSVGIKGGGTADVSVMDCNFNMQPVFNLLIDISGLTLNKMKFEVGGDFNLDANLKWKRQGSFDVQLEAKVVPETTLFVVPVGPIPVTGTFELLFGTEGRAGGTTCEERMGLKADCTITGGAEYVNGSLAPIGTITTSMEPYYELLEGRGGDITIKPLYVRPKFGLKLFNSVGPYIDFRPYGQFHGGVDSQGVNVDAGVGVSGNFGGEVKIFGMWKVLDANLEWMNVYSPLWSATVPIVAIPQIMPDRRDFTDSTDVSLSCETSGATIRYTVDGSNPSRSIVSCSSRNWRMGPSELHLWGRTRRRIVQYRESDGVTAGLRRWQFCGST